MPTFSATEILQIILFFFSIIGLILSIAWMRKHPTCNMIAVPAIVLLAHYTLFYCLILVATHQDMTLSSMLGVHGLSEFWSTVLRLQSIGTVGFMMMIVGEYCKSRKVQHGN